jgi:hypothetical protein
MEEKTNLELQIICQQNGLSIQGGRLEMLGRIKKAGVTELKTEKPEVKSEKRARPSK